MWRKHEAKVSEKPVSLLKELCGGDAELYDCLTNNMYENPLTAIPKTELSVLTAEAERTGHFGVAVDKAIFEASQNPEERERYVTVIHDLASSSFHEAEQAKAGLEKEGHGDLTPALGRKVAYQRLISERPGDVIDVASRFYSQKLEALKETGQREARDNELQTAKREERRVDNLEREGRVAKKEERKHMSREQKREADSRG